MQSILKNTVFLFLLFSTVSSWSQTVNFLNLKVAHSDTAYVDVDGDLSDDLAFINNTIIDAAFMLVVGTQDTIWFSEATEDSITFNYSSLANQSTLAGTTLLCSNWNAQGGSMNTLKYMQFYKKLTATDSVFGYIEYMPFEGPMPSQCSDDTLIIYKTVLSDFINSPIYPGQTCNYSLSSTGAECFGNCQGDISVSIISGVAPYSYSWSTGETTSFIDSLCMGTYTVTITDTLGCVWVDSVFIDTSTFTNNFSISGNFNLGPCDLDAEALPVGNAPFTFDWSTGSTNNTIIDLCDGWYNVTISDVYGCELEDSVFIDNNSLTSSLHPNYYQPAGGACGELICNGQFAILINNGTAPYTIDLSNGDSYSTSYNYQIADSLCAGTYTYTVTDFLGQVSTNTIIIEATSGVTGTTDTIVHNLCTGAMMGLAAIEVLTGQGPFSFSLNNGPIQSSNYFNSLPAGAYSVEVTDDLGCTGIVVFTVGQPTSISVNITSASTCSSSCNGSINISATQGTPPYTYSIDNGLTYQSSNVFSGLCQGNQNIVVQDNNGCLWNTVEVIGAPTALTMSPTFIQPSCHGLSDGSISFNASGGTPFYIYSIDNGTFFTATDPVPNIAVGDYELLAQDANGCEVQSTLTVSEPPAFGFIYISNISPTCGNNDGSFETLVINGNAPYVYSIDGNLTQQFQNGLFSGLFAGVYTFIVTDGNGCQDSTYIALSDVEVQTQTDVTVDATCFSSCDGSLTVSPTSGQAPFDYYFGNNGTVQSTGLFSSLCAEQYFVTMEDDNGCKGIEEVNINQPDSILFMTTMTSPFCSNSVDASITISTESGGDGGPYTHSIDGVTYQASGTFNGLAAGNYTAYVQDGNGCIGTADVEIMSPSPLKGLINLAHVSCAGANDGFIQVIGSGGTPPYSYDVNSNFSGSGIYTGLSGGIYTIQIVDGNGCTWDTTIVLTEPAPLVLTVSNSTDPICNGKANGTLLLEATGGTPLYFFSIDGGTTLFTVEEFNYLNGGSFSLYLEDVNGCNTTSSISLVDPAIMSIDTTNVLSTYCSGICEGVVEITMNNGATPYTINVSSGNAAWVTMDDYIIDSICAGTLSILVADDLGCMDSIDVIIETQVDILMDTSGLAGPNCFGDCNGQLIVDISNGIQPYTLSTTSGIITPVTSNQFSIDSICAGNLYITATDDNDCFVDDTITIADPDSLYFTYSQLSIVSCTACNDGVVQITPVGGTPPYTYDWGVLSSSTTSTANDLTGGTGIVCITDANGCQFCDSVTVDFIDDVGFAEEGFQLLVNPNPAANSIRIESSGPLSFIELFDLKGNLILAVDPLNAQEISLDINDLPNGLYLLKSQSHDESFFEKVVIQH